MSLNIGDCFIFGNKSIPYVRQNMAVIKFFQSDMQFAAPHQPHEGSEGCEGNEGDFYAAEARYRQMPSTCRLTIACWPSAERRNL